MNMRNKNKWSEYLSRTAYLCGLAAFCYTGAAILPKSVLLAVLCFLLSGVGIAGFVYRLVRGTVPAFSKNVLRRRAIVSGAMLLLFLLLLFLGQANGIVVAFGIVVFLFLMSDLTGICSGAE